MYWTYLDILANFNPEPWSSEEAQLFLTQARGELKAGRLLDYFPLPRVWARKPMHIEE